MSFDLGDAVMAGAAYGLYRHGQDQQTAELLDGIGAYADHDQEIHVHIHTEDDELKQATPVNALDYSTVDIPADWSGYIGQDPLKRQLMVYIKAAQMRDEALPHVLLASGMPGVGKGHDLNTNILTPSGWRRLGDLSIADDVIGSNGQATTITDIYKRGILPLYRVTFSDGSSVRCDADHLWRVQSPKQRNQGRWSTLSTAKLMNDLALKNGRPKWYIPMVAPVEHRNPLRDLNLPVEPYLLGVMLGNADFQKGVISLNKDDRDIADRITSAPRLPGVSEVKLAEYPTTTALRFRPYGAQEIIRSIGQEGVAAADKFIPPAYLTAPVAQRRALLAGLMDTDGGVRSDRGQPQFHTTSLSLAGGVKTLVQSLGGTAKVRVLNRGEIRVDILLNENPFRSQRKSSLWKIPTRGPSRSIVSIEPEGEDEVWCIRVDAPDHLYVTEQYIVTHNTTMARLIAQTLGVPIIELVPPFNIYTLVKAAQQLPDKGILFIDEIHKLADSGAKGAEILLKVLEEKVAFMPDGQVIPLNDITVVGATTDRDKLPDPVIDRFKIKPHFRPYNDIELIKIAVNFSWRHQCRGSFSEETFFTIADACRSTPRIAEEMVMAVRDLHAATGVKPSGEELLEFLEVEPDGLTRTHVHYLTAMRQYFAREDRSGGIEYLAGEAAMQQLLRETKQGIARIERFLIEQGYIDRTPRGRRLTQNGIERAEQLIAAGKKASDV